MFRQNYDSLGVTTYNLAGEALCDVGVKILSMCRRRANWLLGQTLSYVGPE